HPDGVCENGQPDFAGDGLWWDPDSDFRVTPQGHVRRRDLTVRPGEEDGAGVVKSRAEQGDLFAAARHAVAEVFDVPSWCQVTDTRGFRHCAVHAGFDVRINV